MSKTLDKKIILIEDSEFSRAMLYSILKKHGFTNIDLPENSPEAWNMIAEAELGDEPDPYDLIITDLNMPDFDGIDLISNLKDDPMTESKRVIIVSADADKGVQSVAKTLGVLAYLTKPIVAKELIAVVEAALEDREIPEVKGIFDQAV